MGGIRAPQHPFELKRSVQKIDAAPLEVIKEVIKEIPCSKQSAELEVIKQKLENEGKTCLSLRMELRQLENKASELDRDNARLKAIVAMAEKRHSEQKSSIKPLAIEKEVKTESILVEKPVLDKKMLIIYTLAALASGLGIGVLL